MSDIFEMAMNGELPFYFSEWDRVDDNGNTVAHASFCKPLKIFRK
jgi:hypothetical protein